MVLGRSASVRTENELVGSDGVAEAAGCCAYTCASCSTSGLAMVQSNCSVGRPPNANGLSPSRPAACTVISVPTSSSVRGVCTRTPLSSRTCTCTASSLYVTCSSPSKPCVMPVSCMLPTAFATSRPSALTLLMDWLPMRNSSSARTGGPPVCCTWNSASGSSPATHPYASATRCLTAPMSLACAHECGRVAQRRGVPQTTAGGQR